MEELVAEMLTPIVEEVYSLLYLFGIITTDKDEPCTDTSQ